MRVPAQAVTPASTFSVFSGHGFDNTVRNDNLGVKLSDAGMVAARAWLVLFTKSGTDVGFQWRLIWFASWRFFYWLLSKNDGMASSWAIIGAALALALSLPAYADFTGKVVAVTSGDTLTVLQGRKQVKVRLIEIDAPEKDQPFGTRARQSLSDFCLGKIARLETRGKDRHQRTLARVYCNGVDANSLQVWRGMAWAFDRYVKNRAIYPLQKEARAAGRGLWADPKPVPPWEWRRQKRRK